MSICRGWERLPKPAAEPPGGPPERLIEMGQELPGEDSRLGQRILLAWPPAHGSGRYALHFGVWQRVPLRYMSY